MIMEWRQGGVHRVCTMRAARQISEVPHLISGALPILAIVVYRSQECGIGDTMLQHPRVVTMYGSLFPL